MPPFPGKSTKLRDGAAPAERTFYEQVFANGRRVCYTPRCSIYTFIMESFGQSRRERGMGKGLTRRQREILTFVQRYGDAAGK